MAQNKYAEQLTILNKHAVGLLNRVHRMMTIFNDPQRSPEFVNDPTLAKFNQNLVKKFPEVPNMQGVSGFDKVKDNAAMYVGELEMYYNIFQDCLEFKEVAYTLLAEVSNNASKLSMETNPGITSLYLDLCLGYAKIQLLLNSIEHRRFILCFYSCAYKIVKNKPEPAYNRLANYMIEYNLTLKRLIDEYASFSTCIGDTLTGMLMAYHGSRSVETLRASGTINPATSSDSLQTPSQTQDHYNLAYASKMYEWIIYGTMLCPNELSSDELMNLLRAALSEGFVVEVYRAETCLIHQEWDQICSFYKGSAINLTAGKSKKFVAETATDAVAKGGQIRHVKRLWLRQEMKVLYHLIKDKPALLGPKIQMVWAALSLAKEEINWYLRHRGASAPGKSKAKKKDEDFESPHIFEIVFYVERLIDLVNTYKSVIQTYYLKYLKGTDMKKLGATASAFITASNVPDGPMAIMNHIMETMRNLADDNMDSLKGLRLNWLRLQSIFSMKGAPVNAASKEYLEFASRMNRIVAHSRNVDDIEGQIIEFGTLNKLWWYHEQAMEDFNRAIRSGSMRAFHAYAFAGSCDSFADESNEFCPEERTELGAEAVKRATLLYKRMAAQIGASASQLAGKFLKLNNQMDPKNAAKVIAARRAEAAKDTKTKIEKPARPGTESFVRNMGGLEEMYSAQKNIVHLSSGFNLAPSVLVFDVRIAPREYLREQLESTLYRSLKEILIRKDGMMARPSLLLRQIGAHMWAFRQIETHCDLDCAAIIRSVLLNHAYSQSLGGLPPDTPEDKEKFIDLIADWYVKFVTVKVPNNGCVFSVPRSGFVTEDLERDPKKKSQQSEFRAEDYASQAEIEAIVEIVGPYGVRVIDHALMEQIGKKMQDIKKNLAVNAKASEELKVKFFDEDACAGVLKKFKDLDALVQPTIVIGNILELRRMFSKALATVCASRVPFIADVVKAAHSQYPVNAQKNEVFVPIDDFAVDCGIDVSLADHSLRAMCDRHAGNDAALWGTMIYAYAASFTAKIWDDAHYLPGLNAHANGAHTLTMAIPALIAMFTVLATNNANQAVSTALKTFAEVAAVIILRLRKLDAKTGPKDLPSLFVFLDEYTQASSYITCDLVEQSFPYALTRSSYRELYAEDNRVQRSMGKTSPGDEVL